MQAAAALFSSGGGAAAGSTAAGAGATSAGGAAAGSGAAASGSTAATTGATSTAAMTAAKSSSLDGFLGLSALASGALDFGAARQGSDLEKFNARQSVIAGEQTRSDMTDQLLDVLAQQRVALAGNGGDLSISTKQIMGATLKRADQVRQSLSLDTALAAQAHRIAARALMTAGETSLVKGAIVASGGIKGL